MSDVATQPVTIQGGEVALPAFSLFSLLWACALLAHQISFGATFASPWDAALTATALLTLLRPSSPPRFFALCALHAAAAFHHLPDVFNHWYFSALHSFTLCSILAAAFLTRRSLDPAHFQPAIAAACRLNLAILYFFSGFHKLNESYFSIESSCGVSLYGKLLNALPFLPDSPSLRLNAAYLGVAIELTLPFLLFSRRLRRPAVLLGLLFHLGLGLMSYRRFSLIAYALLVASLPELGALLVPRLQRLFPTLPPRWLIWPALVLFALAAAFRAFRPPLRDWVTHTPWLAELLRTAAPHIPEPDAVLFYILSATFIAACGLLLWRQRFHPVAPLGWPSSARPALLGVVLVVASGLSPYLGLRTLNTFAMYSNLRTEGDSSNHFLIPSSWQVFDYQRDLVSVEESNIPELHSIASRGLLVPYQQLRAAVSRQLQHGSRDLRIVYRRAGQRHVVPAAELHPELGRPLPALAVKFLTFRPIEPSGPRRCSL
ncbi:MAG: HTTM domain-containing protein [Acidobacteria bacterium]|nr:HTTM domain-containing protein [Acidobacteriota bacterium]